MPAPSIRHVGTTNGISTYKIADENVYDGFATVVVGPTEMIAPHRPTKAKTLAYCSVCYSNECPHAKRALRRAKTGR